MDNVISPRLENYIAEISSKSSAVKLDGYFHVDAVIEAYNKGEKNGIEQTLEILREKLVRDSTKMFLYSTDIVVELLKQKYEITSTYINPFEFKFLILTTHENTINEYFIELFYSLAFKAEKKFKEETGSCMRISFIPNKNINEQELLVDGYVKLG